MHTYEIGEEVRWFDEDAKVHIVPIIEKIDNGSYVLDLGHEEVVVPVTDLHPIGDDDTPKENTQTMNEQYDDSIFDDGDDLLTPESLDELTRNPNHIPESNEMYQLKLVHVQIQEKRDDEDWLKLRTIWAVDQAPSDVKEPTAGWGEPRPQMDFFLSKPEMSDGQKRFSQRSKRDCRRLIEALGRGGDLEAVVQAGPVPVAKAFLQVLEAAKGDLVLARVRYDESDDGEMKFLKLIGWRPVEG